MTFTDNPIADFERHDREKEKALSMLPVCECCGNPIQQKKAVYYNDQWCCKECEEIFWLNIRDDFLEDANG